MEKIEQRLYFVSFLLAISAIVLTLLMTSRQRELFYFSFYIAMIGLFVERKKIRLPKMDISYAIILIGLVKIIWTLVLYRHLPDYGLSGPQLDSGKKLIVGGVLVFYLNYFSHYLTTFNYRQYLLTGFALAFVLATGYGIYQVYHSIERIDFSTNRATVAAYIYSTLSILLVYLLIKLKKNTSYYVAASAVIIISFLIVIMTGTRAAVLAHLFLMLLMILFHFRRIHLKPILIVLVLLGLVGMATYSKYIKPKIEQTSEEIMLYQKGDDLSSLGSRFSLWKVGFDIFLQHPFGNTVEARYAQAAEIIAKAPQNKTALTYINVHLHDELLEAASLQGVVGLLTVFFFYGYITMKSLVGKNTPLLMIGCCMIVYGLTDVLLTSPESVIFYLVCIALFKKKISTKNC